MSAPMTSRDRAILYEESMVAAILARLKRQTRRPMRPQPVPVANIDMGGEWTRYGWHPSKPVVAGSLFHLPDGTHDFGESPESREMLVRACPYGMPGDTLVQLSSWAAAREHDSLKPTLLIPSARIWSRWDGTPKPDWCGKLRPGRFLPGFLRDRMPRARVTEVRVERVQSISEADAIAEGLARITKDGTTWKFGIPDRDRLPGTDDLGWPWDEWCTDPRAAYRHLWELTYGAESWARNDWVWVVSFEQIARVA